MDGIIITDYLSMFLNFKGHRLNGLSFSSARSIDRSISTFLSVESRFTLRRFFFFVRLIVLCCLIVHDILNCLCRLLLVVQRVVWLVFDKCRSSFVMRSAIVTYFFLCVSKIYDMISNQNEVFVLLRFSELDVLRFTSEELGMATEIML